MKFGPVKPDDAWGAVVAHSLKLEDGTRLKKGHIVNGNDVQKLKDNGVAEIIAAITEDGEVPEDAAATIISEAISLHEIRKDLARTGRLNFFAVSNGVFRVDRELVNQINSIDPAITFATLEDCCEVNEGRIVATIKIIPYAVTLENVEKITGLGLNQIMRVAPYLPKNIGMIATKLPSLKQVTMDKTRHVLESRLALSGSKIVNELRVEHDQKPVSAAINKLLPDSDIVVIFGASAICDINDIIPSAIRETGGDIIRFGMPVDPGNLLLLGEVGGKPVIGAPGCARSPAENGFDWVLMRLLAGMPVESGELAGMGVGGLLMETGSRPHPRQKKDGEGIDAAAILLAAGQSRRAGKINKLLAEIDGKALVSHVIEAISNSDVKTGFVVTGHGAEHVSEKVSGSGLEVIHNPDFEAGLSSSLAAGVRAIGPQKSHVLVLLGDMPFVSSAMINKLIKAARKSPEAIIVSTSSGKRGNPVLWPRRYFEELMSIEGDVGARHIIGANSENVVEVELGEAASTDLDTPEALVSAGATISKD